MVWLATNIQLFSGDFVALFSFPALIVVAFVVFCVKQSMCLAYDPYGIVH
jgi:hypothetical protein